MIRTVNATVNIGYLQDKTDLSQFLRYMCTIFQHGLIYTATNTNASISATMEENIMFLKQFNTIAIIKIVDYFRVTAMRPSIYYSEYFLNYMVKIM